jgi:hypothetical protein
MITKLYNPKTDSYKSVKELILSDQLPWFYESTSTHDSHSQYDNPPFYSHVFLLRPNWNGLSKKLYPEVKSGYTEIVHDMLVEICEENNLNLNCFYRINANAVHPTKTNKLTTPHYDHQFPHVNLLMYFTDSGGETIVYDENNQQQMYNPKEDDIIVFSGLHCHRPPKEKRRVILVATFI